MGAIISRWRKKHSTLEVLDSLENEIESLEKLKRQNLEKQKKIIGSLILYSVLLYISTVVFVYFYQWPTDWKYRIIYLGPLLVFPVIVWLLKRFLHWYFVKRISKNEMALGEKKNQKKNILEEVMEKETYKKAKEILEKYDPDRFKKIEDTVSLGKSPTPQKIKGTPQSAASGSVRQRIPQSVGKTPGEPMGTPHLPRGQLPVPHRIQPQQAQNHGMHRGPPLPQPILPRERSVTDRLVEYLVGDGPQNRYALICKSCCSHNGMALKEEFDFIAFRCCYCYTFNPARKRRPQAPQVEFSSPSAQQIDDINKIGAEFSEDQDTAALPEDDSPRKTKDDGTKITTTTESVGANCDEKLMSEDSDIDMLTDDSDTSNNQQQKKNN